MNKAVAGNKGLDRTVLYVEAAIGAAGLLLAVVGMIMGWSAPARALPHSILSLLGSAVRGESDAITGAGLWLLALGPVAAVATTGVWALRQRHWRTAALAAVALAAIAFAAAVLPTG